MARNNPQHKNAFSLDPESFKDPAKATQEATAADNNTTNLHNTATHTQTQQTYTTQEMRSKRVQFVIKPSVNAKLDELAKNGAIKSKNDLVNFLLESYIAQLEG